MVELNPKVLLGIEGFQEVPTETLNPKVELFSSYLEEAVEWYSNGRLPEPLSNHPDTALMEIPEQSLTDITKAVVDFAKILLTVNQAKYVAYYEQNDWEGEEWTTFIKWEGNEEALQRLSNLLDPEGEEFSLDLTLVPHYVVNVLTEYADVGYFARYSILSGQLNLEKLSNLEERLSVHDKFDDSYVEMLQDVLYKGGIGTLMQNE